MKKLKKSIRLKLLVAILFSIFLPTGILFIIFGAGKSTFMLVAGIIMAVLGFYGTPMIWISFANSKRLMTVLRLIENEHIYKVSDLASQLSYKERQINETINILIHNGYLTGYLFHDGVLEINTNKKQTGQAKTMKCPTCGGLMEFDGIHYVCKYCGYVTDEDKN